MQGNQFQVDFLIPPSDNFDMILGIQWLIDLGDIMRNFKRLQMKFHIGGQECLLQWDNGQDLKLVSQANMHRLLVKETQLSLTQCFTIIVQSMISDSSNKAMEKELVVVTKTMATRIA